MCALNGCARIWLSIWLAVAPFALVEIAEDRLAYAPPEHRTVGAGLAFASRHIHPAVPVKAPLHQHPSMTLYKQIFWHLTGGAAYGPQCQAAIYCGTLRSRVR